MVRCLTSLQYPFSLLVHLHFSKRPMVLYFVCFVDISYTQSARVNSDVSQCAEDEQSCNAFQEDSLHQKPVDADQYLDAAPLHD